LEALGAFDLAPLAAPTDHWQLTLEEHRTEVTEEDLGLTAQESLAKLKVDLSEGQEFPPESRLIFSSSLRLFF
jgi:hypothetical protein